MEQMCAGLAVIGEQLFLEEGISSLHNNFAMAVIKDY